MIKVSLDKKYLVNKGRMKLLVEIYKDHKGTTYAVITKTLTHVIEEEGKVKEWEHDIKDAEEISYENLPPHVRKAISSALIR